MGNRHPFMARPYLVLGQDGGKVIVLVEKEEIGLGVEELCLVFRNAYVLWLLNYKLKIVLNIKSSQG